VLIKERQRSDLAPLIIEAQADLLNEAKALAAATIIRKDSDAEGSEAEG